MNNIEIISQHPDYSKQDLELDHRLERCFQDLSLKKAICCLLVTDRHLLDLNRQVLDHDYYTDIITFDYSSDSDYTHSELYISLDRVKENAKEYEVGMLEELHRVIIHGMLHLAGHTDKTEDEKQKMRSLENHYLALSRST
ncbi:MAG: rRNA maturation RNase YbeY [Bacteroidia bacterium]